MGLFGNKEESQKKKQAKIAAKEEKKLAASQEKQLKKQQQKEAVARVNEFKPSLKVGNLLFIDQEKRQFRVKGFLNALNIYKLDDINGYEVIENGESVTSGGLGRAAVGALAFGGAGAIIGAVTGKKQSKSYVDSMEIKITMYDLDNPVVYIPLINSKYKRSSLVYKSQVKLADQVIATLDTLLRNSGSEVPVSHEQDEHSTEVSPIDEIRKYKELLDDGILTQEEFDAKKKELLDL